MKKTQKQFFGCLGLGVVAAMTAVAIALPSPQASATSIIQDSIIVKVISDIPIIGDITVTKSDDTPVEQKEIVTDPNLTVEFAYDGVETIQYSLSYTYTNADGTNTKVYDDFFGDFDADFNPGTMINSLNLHDDRLNINGTHGYGHYVLTVTGVGQDGVTDEKSFEFSYAPFIASAEQNETNGKIDVHIDEIDTENVSTIDVYVDGEKVGTAIVDEDGSIIYSFYPSDTTKERDLHIVLVAKDSNGNPIYMSDEIIVHFSPLAIPDTGAPDTGGLLRELNISQEDYLVTGLIAFFVVGIVGFGVVARGRREKQTNKSQKRR